MYEYHDLKEEFRNKHNDGVPLWGRIIIVATFITPFVLYIVSCE